MTKESRKNLQMDPRTEIMLIFIANIVAFANSSVYVETLIIVAISVLLLLCGCKKSSIKWIVFYGILLFIQYYLIQVMPTFLAVMFSVLAIYARKLLPCMMIGELIIRTIPVRLIILSLQKWKVPQKIIIPLSITIRYFPAIKEEVTHIKEAMKMRKIKGIIRKIECMYVPMLISAANTAEELSAAAITRGIENPAPKTSVVDIRFHIQDYICLGIGIIFTVIIIMQ
ncbi:MULTISPECIES: energy-coupling factor transporter transmembrane component T [Clostridium]|uniref:Energy-coupling factor transporter transmembrane protein EcfT n=1 Tax=Clostridium sporogenes TaxID=1509 RepID=A0A7X5SXC1_CLOSG|nr:MULTISPECIES: energy-coupling factor transporter transmembrane component T [Clostridium]AJD29497.1 cobalt transport family protein [Clostridium botulinum Prevot_594]KOY64833.1 cobalt transporter [Clostridium sporogenes]KRU47337.1 cobalt transport protein [Clostridium sporogenes]MBE6056529.1 energy-coupling factor transporter transmembrane protein EcfT [Clostridium sp.]MBY7015961.1 energy-coupling factor transporter transmembrane protein EcfT [Clostridium sporogenes]